MTDRRELHLAARPKTYKDVLGQSKAVAQLVGLGKSGNMPHLLLFTGPSGCGKTTLARITRRKLGCGDADFVEVNAASNRGIDMVRAVESKLGLAPIDGRCRVWLVDEAHALTGDAQGAFLKVLEEPPDHVYFMLATTDPEKLKRTVRTRATEVRVVALDGDVLADLVRKTYADAYGTDLDDDVVQAIAKAADGSARQALVLLESVAAQTTKDDQLAQVQALDAKRTGFELAQALAKSSCTWRQVATILKNLEKGADTEVVRRTVLGYAQSMAIGSANKAPPTKPPQRALDMLEEFREPVFNTGRPGLVLAAARVLNL